MNDREQMNIVIVGHVDHGKSTLIGRLLADTGTLPEGKLEAVKALCARNAKPFEYAFLLDALKDEQSQGITIDTARSFFKSAKRDYIIIDAPGHIEFLKNMITGAARADAAILVIDAKEGIKENSKRHGYMLSFLGIKNITVGVNKMDLINYDQKTFEKIKEEYSKFLDEIHLKPKHFIPIAAREGKNLVKRSAKMPWYQGLSVLEAFDDFAKPVLSYERPFRMPVQDIYKFTEEKDERRIIAGRVESGTLNVGDEVIFMPSNKVTRVKTIEGFNVPTQNEALAGQSTGVTLETQIYIRPGETMLKTNEKHPHVGSKFRASVFWMAKQPLVRNKNYKLKLTTQHVPVVVSEIVSVLDASELSSQTKTQVDRHEVAECILETLKPIAFDEIAQIPETGRFVIIDHYEISGGGIIIAPVFEQETTLIRHVKSRQEHWEHSKISSVSRAQKYQQKSAVIMLAGEDEALKKMIAQAVEEELFKLGKHTYFLGIPQGTLNEEANLNEPVLAKLNYIRQLGEIFHVLTDAGVILITTISDIDEYDLQTLSSLTRPHQTVVINVGEYTVPPEIVSLQVSSTESIPQTVKKILDYLTRHVIALDPEYLI